jgi:membrane protein implicated in regulation of membrane protease activity
MEPWVVWIVVAAALAAGEMLTMGLFLAPFAIGAVLAAAADVAGGGAIAEWAVFVVISALLLAFARPLAVRHRRQPPRLRSGTAALVGRSGIVLERIGGADDRPGTVKIGGEVWTARAYGEGGAIEPGTRVDVIEIQGATALVSEGVDTWLPD